MRLRATEGVSVLPRGGGTSQAGQTVNQSLVIDCSKHLNKIIDLDVAGRRCAVEPGIVLDELNRKLEPHGLWFPVDISTASRATIGGMTGNNSCGGRSLRYGNTRENVLAIDALLADGSMCAVRSGQQRSLRCAGEFAVAAAGERSAGARRARGRTKSIARFSHVQRRVGGYNLDALLPGTQRSQSRAYPGRLRRHARVFDPHRTEAVRRCCRAARSAPVTSAASTRRWRRHSTSCGSSRSRSNWSTAP